MRKPWGFVRARETSPVSASTCAEQASNVYGSFVSNTPICLRAGEQAPPPPSSEGAATWPSPAHPAARVPIRPDLSGQGGSKSSLARCSAATVTRPRIDPATRRKEEGGRSSPLGLLGLGRHFDRACCFIVISSASESCGERAQIAENLWTEFGRRQEMCHA